MASGFSLSQLNAAQREAVQTTEGPVLILAGAGTGKTRTVTCRLAQLVKQGQDPRRLLAVTFTNKAASEMRERIEGMLRRKDAKAMTVCTFHSLCVRILRDGIGTLGYKPNFSICTASDQQGLIKQLIIQKGGSKESIKPAVILGEISKQKSSGQPLEEMENELFSAIAISYQNELRARNSVDFDDLLILADRVLSQDAAHRSKWQNLFRYLTVDEFQDTNRLQLDILRNLAPSPYNVCVVGDDDQSIYGWRGAEVSNILDFEKHFPNPKIIHLEENYRSSESILAVANKLIEHNLTRRKKVLRATIQGGDKVQLITLPGDEEEAEYIVEELRQRRRDEPTPPWEDFAVLFRTNTQIRLVERTLREEEIPYRLVGAQSFFDRREIRDALAYLQLLENPDSDVPLLRILNTPPRGIGQNTAMLATDYSRDAQTSVWDALQSPPFTEQLSSRAQNSITQFTDLIHNAREELKQGGKDPAELLEALLETCKYEEWLIRQCKTEPEKEQRREALYDLYEALRHSASKGKSLQAFLDESTLDPQKEDDLEEKTGVTLITLHAAKGLEFPEVFLVGLEENLLPHKRSIDDRNLDEERRLLYVGITRAQKRLMLTRCAQRKKWGEMHHCEPSRFINELDFTYIDELDYEELMNSEASDDELEDFFGNLKSMIE